MATEPEVIEIPEMLLPQQQSASKDDIDHLRMIATRTLQDPVRAITDRVHWYSIYTDVTATRDYFTRIKKCRTFADLQKLVEMPTICDKHTFKTEHETLALLNNALIISIMMEV